MTAHPHEFRDFTGPDYGQTWTETEVAPVPESSILVRAARVGVNVLKLLFDTANADY